MTRTYFRCAAAILLIDCLVVSCGSRAEEPLARPIAFEHLVNADTDLDNWLTYSRTYDGQRFSPLAEVNRETAAELQLRWMVPIETAENVETTPLVIDGVMYFTKPTNRVVAVDAASGHVLWEFAWPERQFSPNVYCCGKVNRGLAVLDSTLYLTTGDAHLVAIDRATGKKKWDVEVGDPRHGFTISAAPLAIKNLVLTGIVVSQAYSGQTIDGVVPDERGYIDAYDAETGVRKWRFYTVPAAGEKGGDTWAGDSWRNGRASSWLTGSYDPDLDLLYWGVGNPSPLFDGRNREGDNLYSGSVVALDPDTGILRWHFQFTPHDVHDWDSAHIFVLADQTIGGKARKVLLNANRNGFFYVLDRATGEFLLARPFARQTWAKGIDHAGRPILLPNAAPSESGTVVAPNADGATSWWSPSYNRQTNLYYVTAHDASETFFYEQRTPRLRGEVISFIRAIRPQTGEIAWEYQTGPSTGGILTTAGELLFSGNWKGEFWALDAGAGKKLWQDDLGAMIHAAPITYRAGGEQLITVASKRGLFTFGLTKGNDAPLPRSSWLQVLEGSRATHVPHDTGIGARIDIQQAPSNVSYHVQWNVERFSVSAATRYSVRFRAKADRARRIGVGFARAYGDRRGIGLYRDISLTTDWQDFTLPFVAEDDERRARILFDVGGNGTSLDISNVELVRVP